MVRTRSTESFLSSEADTEYSFRYHVEYSASAPYGPNHEIKYYNWANIPFPYSDYLDAGAPRSATELAVPDAE